MFYGVRFDYMIVRLGKLKLLNYYIYRVSQVKLDETKHTAISFRKHAYILFSNDISVM